MKQIIREAIKEVTEGSEFEASFNKNKTKEESSIQHENNPNNNLNISLHQEDSIVNDDMHQSQKLIRQQFSIDVNTIRSLGQRSPSGLNFDQSFFNSDQKIPRKVQDEFLQLSSFIQDLNKKIAEIVVQNEADFLKIYKQQMSEVFKELMKLKRRIEDEDFKLKRNLKIQVLTEEKNYFYKQAIFLDEKCRVLENENNELKFKNKILRDDLNNYQGLIIDVKKENKQLKSELLFLYQNNNFLQENKNESAKKEKFIPSEQLIEKQQVFELQRSSSQNSQKSFKEQIFNNTCLPKSLQMEYVKRSSSCKLLNLSQVNQNLVPSSPLSTTNRTKIFKQKQNSQEIQTGKLDQILNQNNQYQKLLLNEQQKLQNPQKQEQRVQNKSSSDIQAVFLQNQIIKNQTDLLKQSKKKLKLDLQLSIKGVNALDLEQTRQQTNPFRSLTTDYDQEVPIQSKCDIAEIGNCIQCNDLFLLQNRKYCSIGYYVDYVDNNITCQKCKIGEKYCNKNQDIECFAGFQNIGNKSICENGDISYDLKILQVISLENNNTYSIAIDCRADALGIFQYTHVDFELYNQMKQLMNQFFKTGLKYFLDKEIQNKQIGSFEINKNLQMQLNILISSFSSMNTNESIIIYSQVMHERTDKEYEYSWSCYGLSSKQKCEDNLNIFGRAENFQLLIPQGYLNPNYEYSIRFQTQFNSFKQNLYDEINFKKGKFILDENQNLLYQLELQTQGYNNVLSQYYQQNNIQFKLEEYIPSTILENSQYVKIVFYVIDSATFDFTKSQQYELKIRQSPPQNCLKNEDYLKQFNGIKQYERNYLTKLSPSSSVKTVLPQGQIAKGKFRQGLILTIFEEKLKMVDFHYKNNQIEEMLFLFNMMAECIVDIENKNQNIFQDDDTLIQIKDLIEQKLNNLQNWQNQYIDFMCDIADELAMTLKPNQNNIIHNFQDFVVKVSLENKTEILNNYLSLTWEELTAYQQLEANYFEVKYIYWKQNFYYQENSFEKIGIDNVKSKRQVYPSILRSISESKKNQEADLNRLLFQKEKQLTQKINLTIRYDFEKVENNQQIKCIQKIDSVWSTGYCSKVIKEINSKKIVSCECKNFSFTTLISDLDYLISQDNFQNSIYGEGIEKILSFQNWYQAATIYVIFGINIMFVVSLFAAKHRLKGRIQSDLVKQSEKKNSISEGTENQEEEDQMSQLFLLLFIFPIQLLFDFSVFSYFNSQLVEYLDTDLCFQFICQHLISKYAIISIKIIIGIQISRLLEQEKHIFEIDWSKFNTICIVIYTNAFALEYNLRSVAPEKDERYLQNSQAYSNSNCQIYDQVLPSYCIKCIDQFLLPDCQICPLFCGSSNPEDYCYQGFTQINSDCVCQLPKQIYSKWCTQLTDLIYEATYQNGEIVALFSVNITLGDSGITNYSNANCRQLSNFITDYGGQEIIQCALNPQKRNHLLININQQKNTNRSHNFYGASSYRSANGNGFNLSYNIKRKGMVVKIVGGAQDQIDPRQPIAISGEISNPAVQNKDSSKYIYIWSCYDLI
ncbi:hypothetical protein ABPG72_003365 [Tetrahymena utriculariae]